MKYRVIIRKENAPNETRFIEAPSRFAVYDQIRNEDGFVISITELHAFSLASLSQFNISIGTGISHTEIIRIAKNLSAMLTAGLSLSRALSILERQSKNTYLQKVVRGVSDSIKDGFPLHKSLAAYPHVFPSLFIAMTRAGEESGSLSEALNVVALQMERSEELTRKIKGAMIYPSIVITAIGIVGVLMLVYVVPTLTSTFKGLGVALPLSTQIIVAVSDFMAAHSLMVLVALATIVVGGYIFIRSKTGSRLMLALSLHLPVVSELVRETYTARAARTLSSLLSSSVPVLDALSITKEVVNADVFANVISEAEEHVKKGELLSLSFSEHPALYPILMSDMLAVGEETGKVADMLKQIAEFYETDVAEKTKDLSTIIEPVLMLFIGTAVGIFAISMIGPIYSLSSAF